ncbi:hypothetical protein [Arthrobacter sp. FW306-04-A]|uniref:hypothetical protein n=1 Tax=Arthrobacter sp. FW306-04-A TaxID=2879619 RepID=UPI0037BFCBD6|nr:hypothetical protein LFT43_15750 [Arthrobacter sp. FW306-04-A]
MYARVSNYAFDGDGEALRKGFDDAVEPLKQLAGLTGAYFLLDADSKTAISITLWDTKEALESSVEAANRLRADATQPSKATIESVKHYEVTNNV